MLLIQIYIIFKIEEYDIYKDKLLDHSLATISDKDLIKNQQEAVSDWASDNDNSFSYHLKTHFLIILPDHDSRLDLEKSRADLEKYTNKTINTIDNSGHNITLQHPLSVCTMIKDFLE